MEDKLARKDMPSAAEDARQYLRVAGDNARSRFVLGMLYAQYGDSREAAVEFREARKKQPQDYDVNYNLALALFRSKQYQQASEVLKQMIARTDGAELHSLLGDVYEESGQAVRALEEYKRALDLDPSSESRWFDLGYEMLKHQTYDGAISVFRSAVQRFPGSFRLWLALGAAYFGPKRIDQALASFARATDLDPNSEIGYRFLADGCLTGGNFGPESEARFKRFFNLNPSNPWACYLYALALEKGQPESEVSLEQSAVLYAKAVSLRPDFYDAYLALGRVYFRQRKFAQAAEYLKAAITLNKGSPDPHYQLAQTYVRLDRRKDAEKEFQLYKQLRASEQVALKSRSDQVQKFILLLK